MSRWPPPVRKLRIEDNEMLQSRGGIGTLRSTAQEMKLDTDNRDTLGRIRQLGAAGADDLQQHGCMLVELPEWLSKKLKSGAVDRYISAAGGYRSMKARNGKLLLARPEPLDNSSRFDEVVNGLAAASRLIATALLGHRHGEVLTPSVVQMLQPVEGPYEYASVAHINVYREGYEVDEETGGVSAYSPHVDGGLLTLVTCPEEDECLVVQRPKGGGEQRVPLKPGIAVVLPGVCLSKNPKPCKVSRTEVSYEATPHYVDGNAIEHERRSVTFHLRPNPYAAYSTTETAGAYLHRFYSSVGSINTAGGAPSSISIEVISMTGKHTSFTNVDSRTTVWELKTMMCEREGAPEDQQRLIYEGRQLEDARTLQSYNIAGHVTIHQALRLRGD